MVLENVLLSVPCLLEGGQVVLKGQAVFHSWVCAVKMKAKDNVRYLPVIVAALQ